MEVSTPRLQSYNYPDRYIRHVVFDVRTDANVSPAQDARFRLVPGLAAPSGHLSFESVNHPGYYLRHHGFDFVLAGNDGSAAFAADATSRQVPGTPVPSWSSFRSYNFPDRYIRHYNHHLRLDPIVSELDRKDSTCRVIS